MPTHRFYVGQTPQILVADVDMLKQILVKDFNNFMDYPVSYSLHTDVHVCSCEHSPLKASP